MSFDIDSKEFIRLAKQQVFDMAKNGIDPTDNVKFSIEDVYVVNYSFVLWNHKALLSTQLPDGKYYEVTYDKETKKMYVDCYVRLNQKVVELRI